MTTVEVQVPEGLAPRGRGFSPVDEGAVAELDLRIVADAVVVLCRSNRGRIAARCNSDVVIDDEYAHPRLPGSS